MKLKLHHVDSGRTLLRVTDPRSVAAFTMIEIALALAVIGFALVAIIGVLPAGMSVQRDNRESTIVNFDANFLMDAITSGTTGLDDLTNHVIAISNYVWECNSAGVIKNPNPQYVVGYTTTGTFVNGSPVGGSYLTNGQNIVALLTTPKYSSATVAGIYYSNYVTADFRAFTGSLADQGTSQSAQSFAFAYRIFPELVDYFAAGGLPWPSNPNLINDPVAGPAAQRLQNNFSQLRLRFRWPIYANGTVGTSRLTFRTAVSGYRTQQTVYAGPTASWLYQPGTYSGQ